MKSVLVAGVGSAIAILARWLLLPSDLVCLGRAIATNGQAVAYAKEVLVTRSGLLDEAGAASAANYIVAIDPNPNCRDALYDSYKI